MADFPGSTRGAFWALGIFVLLLTLLSSANLYLLLRQEDGLLEVIAPQEEPAAPIFVRVGPMTVNLSGDAYTERLLYAGLTLRVDDERSATLLRMHMPELHSRLLLLLSGQSAEQLGTPGGKEELAEQVLALLSQPLTERLPPPAVSAVLFTDFIVQ